ncbi:uncharacterized protein BO66DRAFT_451160 [Aspergillus aculeatinus CBS 121060]|uniref:Uncharacterized protein n=1 Tax=Aspergillus aculeatinus CBS 121060 TaxID=1448322 RepID=A0ACD1H9R0_9EURO|nr:hypothetical protein BO66DRAFT_451160 [Aspergillus aculeatinus CBS 121060]RAH70313.1 hypothetical protein BO66DRAFT_451160 [Aspergillus aculeatinus CBS 121060]
MTSGSRNQAPAIILTFLHPDSQKDLPYRRRADCIVQGGYNSGTDVKLRIGNGGAGQSGLIEALADTFIKASVENGSAPFKVAWYKSHTTSLAIRQRVAEGPSWYAWRDYSLLVGPHFNPVRLNKTDDILTMFSSLYTAAENDSAPVRTRFLSRYDKSTTNIKESDLWIGIGQVPWATTYSTWYHQYIAYYVQALTAAILLEEYTVTDRGTYLTISEDLQSQTAIYKAGTDSSGDPLLNPAHISFAQWIRSSEGQAVITGFKKNGRQLYTGAPANKTAHFEDLCR